MEILPHGEMAAQRGHEKPQKATRWNIKDTPGNKLLVVVMFICFIILRQAFRIEGLLCRTVFPFKGIHLNVVIAFPYSILLIEFILLFCVCFVLNVMSVMC